VFRQRQQRTGRLRRLLSAVCEGQLSRTGIRASRLARNTENWHPLIDLCLITETLVIDGDGVYVRGNSMTDWSSASKAPLSEFELGLIETTAQEALRQKIQRGEVLTVRSGGICPNRRQRVEMSPDLQVRRGHWWRLCTVSAPGQCAQVLLWYRRRKSRSACTFM